MIGGPKLSIAGWLTTADEILNYIIQCYITSNFSQSLTYKGNVVSLAADIYQGGNIPENVGTLMQRSLSLIASRYFPEFSEVIVRVNKIYNSDLVNIDISISVRKDGKAYSASESISGIKNDFSDIYESLGTMYGFNL